MTSRSLANRRRASGLRCRQLLEVVGLALRRGRALVGVDERRQPLDSLLPGTPEVQEFVTVLLFEVGDLPDTATTRSRSLT